MSTTNPELNWNTVTKGRRSRKSIGRSLNGVLKIGNCISPKRVGDFSGSDSDKFGDVALGKSENVPLKKRRHLLQSPQSHPWASSLCGQNSASPRARSASPFSGDHEQLQYPSCSSGLRSSKWHLKGIEGSAKVEGGDGSDVFFDQTEKEHDTAGDFSGIELLAAAASMDDDPDNADRKGLLDDSSMPKNPDAFCSATLSEVSLKNESQDSWSEMKLHEDHMDCSQQNNSSAASKSHTGSPEDGNMQKVSRQHWDLNTLMDAWDEPLDDLVAGDTAEDVRDDMKGGQKDSRDQIYSNQGGTRDESSDLNMGEHESTSLSEDRICGVSPNLKEQSQEPPKSICSNADGETSDKVADDRNSIHVLNYNANMKNLNEVKSSDTVLSHAPFTKLCCTSGMLRSEETTNVISGSVAIIQDEDCSKNVSECERSAVPDGNCTRTLDVSSHDVAATESVIDILLKANNDFQENFGSPGTCGPVLTDDLNKQNDASFVSGSKQADCQGKLGPAEFDSKHEDNHYPNDGLRRTIMEDTFKSYSARAQNDSPTDSVGRIGFLIDGRHVSDISQVKNVHMVDCEHLTGSQEGYDSPYEDGELRGSYLYSWEDNALENGCVDYESDGRNGDGSDAADYAGSEIVEGGSEGSHGTRKSVPSKVSPEGKSKSGPVNNHSLRKHSVRDDSDNNEIGGKGSNAGSGTTVEQCIEMVMEEDGDVNRRQLIDQKDAVDVKVTDLGEYASKMTARGKLQSRIEGRSSTDAVDGNDGFFMQQQCRPRRFSESYSRPEREEISQGRYAGRYSRSTTHGERDGVHQWTSWGSSKRYTSNYQGAEGCYRNRPRNKMGEPVGKIDGTEFHDPRPTAHYFSKGLHRPLMRRSPVERDGYFGVGRRIPLTRGVGNYRSRGHYSQRRGGGGGRDFVESFEALPDDAGPVRMPRYLSRRDRSFSPSVGRSGHITLPRKRSRSRSKTRSPRPWHPHRERISGSSRRHSRSPEYRPEGRMERMRLPFPKPSFTSDYGEDYMAPSRGGRFSPQRRCRWVDDHNLPAADNNYMRRRLPVRVFRQSFDSVGPSGRLKSDEYFNRPGRFSLMGNGGRESNYDDRRRGDEGNEMMMRPQHSDGAVNVRRFWHKSAGYDFEMNKMNIEEENSVGVGEPRGGVGQGDGEDDKRTVS